MEKISTTTLAATKMLETAMKMMKEEIPNHNVFEKDIFHHLLKANIEINKVLKLSETKEMPCTRTEKIYTDGACSGNPGPGGWGLVCITNDEEYHPWRQQRGFRHTTNNRMELMAAIAALNMLRVTKTSIEIISDSKYVTDAINKGWLETWAKEGYKKPANADLWQKLHSLLEKVKENHEVKFTWVKGHAGNKWNEMADKLAVEAATMPKDELEIDEEYEK